MAEKDVRLKLIQLNIWQGKILIAVSRFLKEQDADIVCMQEVYSSPAMHIPLLDMLSSLETLQKELAYPHVYFEPTFIFDTNGVEVSFGNAIFSKFPLEKRRVIFTNGELQRVKNWADEWRSNNRNAQIVEVITPEGTFTLANHHGYHELSPTGNETTVQKMQILADELKKLSGPLIMAGDLNITAESAAMRIFDDWLEDLTAVNQVTDTLTQFGKVSGVPCDHILVSEHIKVNHFKVSDKLVSDHTPLILEFELQT